MIVYKPSKKAIDLGNQRGMAIWADSRAKRLKDTPGITFHGGMNYNLRWGKACAAVSECFEWPWPFDITNLKRGGDKHLEPPQVAVNPIIRMTSRLKSGCILRPQDPVECMVISVFWSNNTAYIRGWGKVSELKKDAYKWEDIDGTPRWTVPWEQLKTFSPGPF
jgi:hypothetical protein